MAPGVNRKVLTFAVAFTFAAWPLAWVLWFSTGDPAFAISVFLLGLSLGPCLAVYEMMPATLRQAARRLVLLTGGSSILALSLIGAMELDLEGFFMLLFAGTMGAAIGHTLITVIAGPMLFGRFLCGWGCWRAMIIEFLPLGRGEGRRRGAWTLLPFAGLAACVAGVAASVFIFGHKAAGTPSAMHGTKVAPVAGVIALYYIASIGIAFALKDQRAFCKYLCPSAVILRYTARTSLARIAARPGVCNECGTCTRQCPMDIPIAAIVRSGGRVPSGECILCQRCAHACPLGALHLTFGYGAPGLGKRSSTALQ